MDILNLLIWLFIWPETKNDCQPVKTLLRLTLLAGKWRNSLKLWNKTIASLSLVYSYGKIVDDPSLFLQRFMKYKQDLFKTDFTKKVQECSSRIWLYLEKENPIKNIKIKNTEGEGDSGALVKKYIIWSLH